MKLVVVIFGLVALAFGICFVIALPFMLLWNFAVVSAISVAKPISYWVAFWLMLFFSLFVVGTNSGSKSDK